MDKHLELTEGEAEALRIMSNYIQEGENPVKFARDTAKISRDGGLLLAAEAFETLATKLENLKGGLSNVH